jgi:hypothetical protein
MRIKSIPARLSWALKSRSAGSGFADSAFAARLTVLASAPQKCPIPKWRSSAPRKSQPSWPVMAATCCASALAARAANRLERLCGASAASPARHQESHKE